MKPEFVDLIQNMSDGVYFVEPDRRIQFWSKAAERISGYKSSEVVGRCCFDDILKHVDGQGRSLCKEDCPLAATIRDGKHRETEVYLHHKEGHRVPVWIRTSPMLDDAGNIIGGVELFTDISSRDAMEMRVQELEELAFLDSLTQLANRRFIEAELEGRLSEKRRYGLSFGILFMDIDSFKNFNDEYGHAAGDAVLRTIAATISHSTRPFDLVGRWGGEEFIAIIRQVEKDRLLQIGERSRSLIERTDVIIDGKMLSVTISIGATMARPDDTPVSLINRADKLLYESKSNGRNCLTVDEEE